MSIAFKKYVEIISGVAAAAGVRERDLILRLITSNKFVSPDSILEFRSADDVGTYFGTASVEYKRAVDYFAYISPNISAPEKISFSRWSEAGNGAAVIGNNDPKTLAALNAVNAGAFDITINGVVTHIVGLDLSAAATMAAVAAAIQAKVAAAIVGSTVTYATDGPNRFTVQFPIASLGAVRIDSVSVGVQDAAFLTGLSVAANAYNIAGVTAQTAIDAFRAAEDISDNFASVVYVDALDLAEVEAIAAYVDGENFKYMFLEGVKVADVAAWYAALNTYGGLGLTLQDAVTYPTEYPEQFPAAILAATQYDKRNSVTNYMYRQGQNLTPLVTTTVQSDSLDGQRINYYGQTATAGQKISFYQRGKLMGLATDAADMNVYANEIWLKDAAGAVLMTLQLSISRIPANDQGRAMIAGQLQSVIDQALLNGTISVGKTLNNTQKIFIQQQTGSDTAWRDVESVGYILDVQIEQDVQPDSSIEYTAVYSLIYSKDDAIRTIKGTHQLI